MPQAGLDQVSARFADGWVEGDVAQHCTAGVVLLGNIVASATGVLLDELAASVLLGPLWNILPALL